MPACKKCGKTDPAEFYSYQPRECKTCTRARVMANRNARVDYYREFDRRRSTNPNRVKLYREKTKRLRATVPGMMKAHNAIDRAIKSGAITRPSTCSRCSSTDRIQAHHDDHLKPLDVMWLCPVCHAARHKELGRLRTMARIYDATPEPTMPF